MENIVINNNEYKFIKDYKDNEHLRKSFDKLAQETFGISFESWYESGYWKNRYVSYSIVDNNEVVSNVSVNIINFSVLGKEKLYIQLGTVMTKKEYRNKGLSRFLIETIIKEWKNKCDNIYLFANDSVLDFYPKFGFKEEKEYIYSKEINIRNSIADSKKLDMGKKEDRDFVYNKIMSSEPNSNLFMKNNTDLEMFYCISGEVEEIYYIEKYDSVVVVEHEDDKLYIHEIWSENKVDLDYIINVFANESTKEVVLTFTPENLDGYKIEEYHEEDTTLFMINENEIFKNNKLKFEMLSHA